MHSQRVGSLSQAQRERLTYLEFRLYFMGQIGRPDLSARFGVAPAGATRDIAMYRELAPKNIDFIIAARRIESVASLSRFLSTLPSGSCRRYH